MNPYPKITVITPSFNQGQYIEETILSIIGQDYPNLEYIIIDGGSTDNTIDIIKKYENKIHYWVSEKDKGQSNAINKGLQRASGDIINWINSDDQLVPGALSAIARHFSANPDAIIVHGRIEYFGETSNYFSTNLTKKDLGTKYVSHICMPQPGAFFKKKLIKEQGYLDETLHFSMDTDLFMRAGLHYSLVQVKDVIARFRLHGHSKSVSAFSKTFLSDNKKIFSRVLATLGDQAAIEKMKKLGLFEEPGYLYNKPRKQFDTHRMIFYFLQHRLATLYFQGDRKEFKRIFSFLLKNYTWLLLSSSKLVIYRVFLFFPSRFFHSLTKLKNAVK